MWLVLLCCFAPDVLIVLYLCFFVVLRLLLVASFTGYDVGYGYCCAGAIGGLCLLMLLDCELLSFVW